jgi:hypothetical protein
MLDLNQYIRKNDYIRIYNVASHLCSCSSFFKKAQCKHQYAALMIQGTVTPPKVIDDTRIGKDQKSKGRPAQTKEALAKE